MADYKLGTTVNGLTSILRKIDGALIPHDEANTDYQAYLEWKAIDGNEPEAAD